MTTPQLHHASGHDLPKPSRLEHRRSRPRAEGGLRTPLTLPSRAPELNPVENVWQYLRANWLSNRVFETYEEIIDGACDAWNRLIDLPDTIGSIGTREWAHVGQQ